MCHVLTDCSESFKKFSHVITLTLIRSVFCVISIYCNEVWQHWYKEFFSDFNRVAVHQRNAEEGRSFLHNGKEPVSVLQMCPDTLLLYQVLWGLVCLLYSYMSPFPLSLSFCFASLHSLHKRNVLVQPMSHIFFWERWSRQWSTYQLLVAISSRLPQSQIRPQNKYKTETYAHIIWMLIHCLEIPNYFRQRLRFHVHIEIYEVPAQGKCWYMDFSRYRMQNTDPFRGISKNDLAF